MSSIAPLGNDVSTDVPYRRQKIKLAVGTVAESLHTQLKTSREMAGLRLLFGLFEKTGTLMGQSEASHNFL